MAFPFWLKWLPSNPVVFAKTEFHHPTEKDFMRKFLCTNPEAVTRWPRSFNILVDENGGHWFEYFWGVIHCLKLESSKDQYILSPTYDSFIPAYCTIDYSSDKSITTLRIYLRNKLGFYFNPFAWCSLFWSLSTLHLFNIHGFEKYKRDHGVVTLDTQLPNEQVKSKYL